MACYWPSHQYLHIFWRSLPKLRSFFPVAISRQESRTSSHISVHIQERFFSGCLNLKESFKLSNKQNPLGSYESPNYKKSTGSSLVVASSKTNDIPFTSDNFLDDIVSQPAKDQLMLIDGTPLIYRAYYKIMSNLHHGGLRHADGNGDWVLNIFKSISLVQIVSPDKDFFQLLCPSIRLLRMAPRGSQVVSFGTEEFAEKFGDLKPSQFVDVIALSGDACDNIPGVDGIDLTNALQLIIKFGSLEYLLHNLDQVVEDATREALICNNGQALLNKDLATLRCNLPFCMVPFKISDLLVRKPEDQGEKFINLLRAMSAYAEGSSSTLLENRVLSLWAKYSLA